jgi:hypothetical protein
VDEIAAGFIDIVQSNGKVACLLLYPGRIRIGSAAGDVHTVRLL